MADKKLISIVIPVYNEAENLPTLYEELDKHTKQLSYEFEIIFVDDGSRDNSALTACRIADQNEGVHVLQLARNFGKEAAVSAGLEKAQGDAVMVMDADLQMPPRLIGQFLQRWEEGSEVVIGVFAERNMSFFKKMGARVFYKIMQTVAKGSITPNATDFRLLDREVVDAFNKLTERNRITRGLIDWLGFKRSYVYFKQAPRLHGEPAYTYQKLISLAINSFTSYSLLPLKLAGYFGLGILMLTIPSGIFMYIERYILKDPLHLLFTGTDMLAIMTVFLVGVVLACLGLIALYIAHIHDEVINRPLYIARRSPVAATESAIAANVRERRERREKSILLHGEVVEG